MRLDAAAGGLNFGQFGHGRIVPQWRGLGRLWRLA